MLGWSEARHLTEADNKGAGATYLQCKRLSGVGRGVKRGPIRASGESLPARANRHDGKRLDLTESGALRGAPLEAGLWRGRVRGGSSNPSSHTTERQEAHERARGGEARSRAPSLEVSRPAWKWRFGAFETRLVIVRQRETVRDETRTGAVGSRRGRGSQARGSCPRVVRVAEVGRKRRAQRSAPSTSFGKKRLSGERMRVNGGLARTVHAAFTSRRRASERALRVGAWRSSSRERHRDRRMRGSKPSSEVLARGQPAAVVSSRHLPREGISGCESRASLHGGFGGSDLGHSLPKPFCAERKRGDEARGATGMPAVRSNAKRRRRRKRPRLGRRPAAASHAS